MPPGILRSGADELPDIIELVVGQGGHRKRFHHQRNADRQQQQHFEVHCPHFLMKNGGA